MNAYRITLDIHRKFSIYNMRFTVACSIHAVDEHHAESIAVTYINNGDYYMSGLGVKNKGVIDRVEQVVSISRID